LQAPPQVDRSLFSTGFFAARHKSPPRAFFLARATPKAVAAPQVPEGRCPTAGGVPHGSFMPRVIKANYGVIVA